MLAHESHKLRTYNKSEWKENSATYNRKKRRLKNKKDAKRDNPEESVAIKAPSVDVVYRCCRFIMESWLHISWRLFPIHASLLFAQMAENYKLQDVLLAELSDVNLFCKLIRYPSIRDNMLKTFKVSWFWSISCYWVTFLARGKESPLKLSFRTA